MKLSWLLVSGQMILIVLLASPIEHLYPDSVQSILGFILIVGSVVLALWAILSMRPGTFTVMPEPLPSASLTQSGPYQYIRHPMYSAVILGGSGAAISHADLNSWMLLVALTSLLIIKLLREERYLSKRYDEYASYQRHTKALIPFVY